MARRLRIQYSDAIYHVMARGNGRQDIVQDDADRGRLVACLERAVRRSGWSLYAFVFLTNHLHLVLKTPRPNLAKGMQLFLSSYANGWARRHRHGGHLFQGRYRTELVEDETYLWVLTRYVHLNPGPGRPVCDAGGLDMVELPRLFPPPRSPGLGGLRRVEIRCRFIILARGKSGGNPGEIRCPAAHNAVGLAGESPAVGIDCLST